VREARDEHSRAGSGRFTRALRGARSGGVPIVTYSLIGVNVLVWLLELVTGGQSGPIYQLGAYYPPLTAYEPWRMLTSAFLHSPSSVFHVLFNMYSLFVVGPTLEYMLGRGRYLALYLIAAFGGSVGVLLLAPGVVVVGASGAVFGLLGAYFVITRRLGGNASSILIVIVLNLVLGFFVSGIAWQAHLGGLVAGGLVALVFVMTRTRRLRAVQTVGIAAIAAALVVTTVVRVLL
jgi:membrane associated rhomboid family serine protease